MVSRSTVRGRGPRRGARWRPRRSHQSAGAWRLVWARSAGDRVPADDCDAVEGVRHRGQPGDCSPIVITKFCSTSGPEIRACTASTLCGIDTVTHRARTHPMSGRPDVSPAETEIGRVRGGERIDHRGLVPGCTSSRSASCSVGIGSSSVRTPPTNWGEGPPMPLPPWKDGVTRPPPASNSPPGGSGGPDWLSPPGRGTGGRAPAEPRRRRHRRR
jgi:hypothetical protein